MPDLKELAEQGAEKVLQECLALKSGEVAAIFYDERTSAPAHLLIDAAHRLGLKLRVRQVSAPDGAGLDRLCEHNIGGSL
jgi:hypothetical protein